MSVKVFFQDQEKKKAESYKSVYKELITVQGLQITIARSKAWNPKLLICSSPIRKELKYVKIDTQITQGKGNITQSSHIRKIEDHTIKLEHTRK